MNPVNPNQSEFFGTIRIDSDRQDSFGLQVRINWIDRNHSDRKFGLIRFDRIHSD